MWLKDVKGVLGLEMSSPWGVPGLKISYNIALLKWQGKGLPAEGSCLQRAPYTGCKLLEWKGLTLLYIQASSPVSLFDSHLGYIQWLQAILVRKGLNALICSTQSFNRQWDWAPAFRKIEDRGKMVSRKSSEGWASKRSAGSYCK